jgi:hypothetical protein
MLWIGPRGNTVVDVASREQTGEYRFYDRDFTKQDKASLHKVTRFISVKPIAW